MAGEEDEPLQRAVRNEDAPGLDAVALRDPLPERPVAAARPVVEDGPAFALDHLARAVRELLDGQAVGRGDPPGERDQTHAPSLLAFPAAAS